MKTPVIFVRYEDILRSPDQTYREAFEYMIGKDIPKGSVLDMRLKNFDNL
jgi:hypothetical protein